MSVVFELRTAYGVRIGEQMADRKAALRKAQDARHTFPGCVLVEIFTPEPIVRRVWSDRVHLRLVAAS